MKPNGYVTKKVFLKKFRFYVVVLGIMVLTVLCGWALTDRSAEQNYGTPPGIERFNKDLLDKFEKMRELRGKDYQPRTEHKRSDGWAKYTNRLFLESSPYLIQHAHNPVNWYPWGNEAFETAKKLNRPVLVSIGYSTCHWCHVMEEESYEDEEIAQYLNENYIAIKVDREERPDIDSIYMSAVQAITGRGGWPLNVWLTPDKKPFYGGTYFPARDGDRGANVGFLTLVERLKEVYDTQHDKVEKSSQQLTQIIQKMLRPKTGDRLLEEDLIKQTMTHYKISFDADFGGVSGAPKFPSSLPVRLLLRYHRRTGDEKILRMAKTTLEKMAAGGIYDQAGGGFHRYSTDRQWLVPHFEKMLYDNALLIMAYLEGYQVTGDEAFKRIAKEILRYVKRDMTSSKGAFFSATDADSPTPKGHREEGYFFTWTPAELDEVLGKDRSEVVKAYYAVSSAGNFEGRNILHTPKTATEVAKSLKIPPAQLHTVIEESKELLYQQRNRRKPPLRDEKVLTAWNGLMISAHARAGLILGESIYIDRAVKAANFILENLYIQSRLYRIYKDNQAKQMAFLDDYAFFIAALIDLYEATHDIRWLKKAIELDGILEKYYEDGQNGGFFMTSKDHEALIVREKPAYDGAEPSGNSVAVLNLLRLGEFTLKDDYRKRAQKALTSFLGSSAINPLALSEMLIAFDFFQDSPKEILIVTPERKPEEKEAFLQAFRKQYVPNRILVVVTEGKELESHAKVIPFIKEKYALNGKATAYVCEKAYCKLPAQNPALFSQQISEVVKLMNEPKI
jgi:uncharacterized protein YyaL (SSP411 family)